MTGFFSFHSIIPAECYNDFETSKTGRLYFLKIPWNYMMKIKEKIDLAGSSRSGNYKTSLGLFRGVSPRSARLKSIKIKL